MLSRSFFISIIFILLLAFFNCKVESVVFEAGTGRVNMTPDIFRHSVALGGYGDRNGKPAVGIRDSVYARALVVRQAEKLFCLVSAELDFIPASLKKEVLQRLQKIPEKPFQSANLMLAATHTHAGPTGFALMPENSFNNPRLGIFDPWLLDFTANAISCAIEQAFYDLEAVTVGSGCVPLPGKSRNRRGIKTTDPDLTVVKFQNQAGKTKAVLMNFTAHVTILNPEFMEISGGWAGVLMNRLEDELPDQPVVLFTNGAEGDQSPVTGPGEDTYNRVIDFAAGFQPHIARLLENLPAESESRFQLVNRKVSLPEYQISSTFALTAGEEYQVPTENLIGMVRQLFPSFVELCGVRIGHFGLIGIPGEMMAGLGLQIKQSLRNQEIQHPAVIGLADDYVGYILSKEEYQKGGYEAAVSFYGENLGEMLVKEATALAHQF